MFDGLRPDTCVLVVDNILWDQYGELATAFDVIQYGCDGERRVLLQKERIDGGSRHQGVAATQLNYLVDRVNGTLRARFDCTCR